jgi:hypothetical protein
VYEKADRFHFIFSGCRGGIRTYVPLVAMVLAIVIVINLSLPLMRRPAESSNLTARSVACRRYDA